jgi:hypothetical protein
MKTRTIIRSTLAALALTAVCGAFAPKAEACGGGWWPEENIDYRVQGVARAEKDLENGNYLAAAGSVLRMIPHIRNYKATTRDEIINRAMRVLAVATARSNGTLNVGKEIPQEMHAAWLGNEEEGRVANLEWAVGTLKNASQAKADDVVIESQLGEAMAKLENHQGEARELLEKLASKDLLTTPEAYKALAELRAGAGDSDGRVAALERCKSMAKDAAMCEAHGNS